VRKKSDTTVAVYRCPVTTQGIAPPVLMPGLNAVPVQIDPSAGTAGDPSGMPINTFTIYTLRGCPDINWGDRLVSSAGDTYLVRSQNQFGNHHLELEAVVLTTQPATWRPRYLAEPFSKLGLVPTPDPHDATGIPRCSLCWDPVTRRPTSSTCPECYGTGYRGGFNTARSIQVQVLQGSITLQEQETGDTVIAPGIWAKTDPWVALLGGDLLLLNSMPAIRYVVGDMSKADAVSPTITQRLVNLLPLEPQHALQAVPLAPVAP